MQQPSGIAAAMIGSPKHGAQLHRERRTLIHSLGADCKRPNVGRELSKTSSRPEQQRVIVPY